MNKYLSKILQITHLDSLVNRLLMKLPAISRISNSISTIHLEKLRYAGLGVISIFIAFALGMNYGKSINPENSPDFKTQAVDTDSPDSYSIKELDKSDYRLYTSKVANDKPAIVAESVLCPGVGKTNLSIEATQKFPPRVLSKGTEDVSFYGFLLDTVATPKGEGLTLARAITGPAPVKLGKCVYITSKTKSIMIYSISLPESKCRVNESKDGFDCRPK